MSERPSLSNATDPETGATYVYVHAPDDLPPPVARTLVMPHAFIAIDLDAIGGILGIEILTPLPPRRGAVCLQGAGDAACLLPEGHNGPHRRVRDTYPDTEEYTR